MNEETAVEMFVGGLMMDPNTQAPVVVLKDESGDVILPIWIGVPEATSIASALKQVQMSRPLTHDLMKEVFDQLGVVVQRIVIHDLKESTYFAELVVTFGDKVMVLDSRPSDALALAVRTSAPIFVLTKVLEAAKVLFSNATGGLGQSSESESSESEADQSGSDIEESAPESQVPQGDESEKDPREPNSAASTKNDESFDKVSDFRVVDKEKWKDLLADLDPDDFKYRQ